MDLLHGEVVRLHKGDFTQKTTYATNPHRILAHWARVGVRHAHVVDLGASCGQPVSTALRTEIITQYNINFQVAGGVRSPEDLEYWLACGAHRVVIGSWALRAPRDVLALIKHYSPERITIGCDVLQINNRWHVAIEGWHEHTEVTMDELIHSYASYPELAFLITDISKDGTLQGCNTRLYHELTTRYPRLRYFISGGIKDEADLHQARRLGAWGCIVGKALYEGHLSIEELTTC